MKKTVHPVTALLLVAIVAAVAWRATAGLRDERDDDRTEVEVGPPQGGTIDPEDVELTRHDYETGDCVTWEQGRRLTDSRVVACTEPHLVEVVGRSDSQRGDDYPTDEGWSAIYQERCKPLAERHLGRTIDPYGTLVVGALVPTKAGWARGDRVVSCSLQLASVDGDYVPLSQPMSEVDQARTDPVGTCLQDEPFQRVDCATAHHWEVVSILDLSDLSERPSNQSLFDRCGDVPAGAVAPSGGTVSMTFLGFDPASWAAGSRKGTCAVGVFDADEHPVTQTGRMLPAP